MLADYVFVILAGLLALSGILSRVAVVVIPATAGVDHCPRCRYDLAGLPQEWRCPECGSPYRKHEAIPARTEVDPDRLARVMSCLVVPAAYSILIPAAVIGTYHWRGFPLHTAMSQFRFRDTSSPGMWGLGLTVILFTFFASAVARKGPAKALVWFILLGAAAGLVMAVITIVTGRGRFELSELPVASMNLAAMILGGVAGFVIGHALARPPSS